MRNFPGPFRSPRMLKYTGKPFPLLPTRLPSLPLEVDPLNEARGSGECCELPSVGSGAELQSKSNLVHFSFNTLTARDDLTRPSLVFAGREGRVYSSFRYRDSTAVQRTANKLLRVPAIMHKQRHLPSDNKPLTL